MSATSTATLTESSLYCSATLSSPISSLGSPRKSQVEFSKPYKLATNFFLTRRFSEALSIIKPLISIVGPENGYSEGVCERKCAPIAKADRKWRVRIWSFYLTLLNAIADLDFQEGKATVGAEEWKDIMSKAENGTIWDDVVEVGYFGDEAKVDAEVVMNLANLLLAHSPNQKTNQSHLETYLSIADQPRQRTGGGKCLGYDSSLHSTDRRRVAREENYLQDLETHIQIIELYVLHVLTRNEEWDYAREFVRASYALDEDRKDEFFQTLSNLQEEGHDEVEEDQVKPELLRQHGLPSDPSMLNQVSRTDSDITIVPASTVDRIIGEDLRMKDGAKDIERSAEPSALRSVSPKPAEMPSQPHLNATGKASSIVNRGSWPAADSGQPAIVKRTIALFSIIHKVLSNTMFHISQDPAVLLRFILFLVALVGALGRKDLRERLRILMERGMKSVKRTLGMGLKVSYV